MTCFKIEYLRSQCEHGKSMNHFNTCMCKLQYILSNKISCGWFHDETYPDYTRRLFVHDCLYSIL